MCTQPGCTGTIVDGYCDVCGSPGPQEAADGRGRRSDVRHAHPPGRALPAAPAPSAVAQRHTLHAAGLHRPHRRRLLRRLRQPRRRPGARFRRRSRSRSGRQRPGRRRGIDHHPRFEPAGLDGVRLEPGGRQRFQDHQTGACRLPAAAIGAARRRADPGATRPGDRRVAGDHEEPRDPRGEAQLPELRRTGRPVPRRTPGARRGLLRQVRQRVLLHPQAAAR